MPDLGDYNILALAKRVVTLPHSADIPLLLRLSDKVVGYYLSTWQIEEHQFRDV